MDGLRNFVRIIRGLWLLTVIAALGVASRVKSSPAPFIDWMRRQPDPGPPVPPPGMADYEKAVDVRRDVVYPSKFKANEMDIYWPKNRAEKLPTILWVHGGGFVAGDKSGTADWCTLMAAKGYTVVSMNYEVAPEARYPAPVLQMAEVYEYLTAVEDEYPTLDLKRLIIGGDSAGAQIASQFLAIQSNPVLSRLTGIRQSVPLNEIKAALLFCGPYNVRKLADVKDRMSRFIMNHFGWAYIGERNWLESDHAQHASTVHYVTGDFPPAFITDGNTGSFEKHGRELEEKLRAAGIPVTSLFFPLNDGIVHHEYQFKMNTPEATACLELTLSFLEGRLNIRPD